MRSDLRALRPEGLAALTNWGLVKRAQREIEAGYSAQFEEYEGHLKVLLSDGIVVEFPAQAPLDKSLCSCQARPPCRHRLAALLLYAADSPPCQEQSSDIDLEQLLGKRLLAKALKLKGKVSFEVQAGDEPWVALETCNVRFTAGHRLQFAHCDCAAPGACEHLALAWWALQGDMQALAQSKADDFQDLLELVEQIVFQGAAQIGSSLRGRFLQLRRRWSKLTWVVTLLSEIEEQLGYFEQASSLYQKDYLSWCLLSLWSRCSSGQGLGQGTLGETRMAQTRLIALGVRLQKQGYDLYFAQPESRQRLLLRQAKGRPEGSSSHCQLLTAALHRQANGRVRLGRGPHSQLPLPDWSLLGFLHSRPGPTRPLLEGVMAASQLGCLRVQALGEERYSPAEQELVIPVLSQLGWVDCRLRHRGCAPFALECLWESKDRWQWVAGTWEGGSLQPTAVHLGEQILVPDLAEQGSLQGARLGPSQLEASDPLSAALEAAWNSCCEVFHLGSQRAHWKADELRALGLERWADLVKESAAGRSWIGLGVRLQLALSHLGGSAS